MEMSQIINYEMTPEELRSKIIAWLLNQSSEYSIAARLCERKSEISRNQHKSDALGFAAKFVQEMSIIKNV